MIYLTLIVALVIVAYFAACAIEGIYNGVVRYREHREWEKAMKRVKKQEFTD